MSEILLIIFPFLIALMFLAQVLPIIIDMPGFSLVETGVLVRNILGQKTRKEIPELLHEG